MMTVKLWNFYEIKKKLVLFLSGDKEATCKKHARQRLLANVYFSFAARNRSAKNMHAKEIKKVYG